MLPASNRLRSSREFAATIRGRGAARAGSTALVVHGLARDDRRGRPLRLGLVVSKSVGNAVVRNRTQRRIRAIIRDELRQLPSGIDVVIRAQPAAAMLSYQELRDVLIPLLHKVIRRIDGMAAKR